MKRKELWTGLAAAAGIFLLVLDSRTALAGARTGLFLCLKTVIPSLLPFFLLSGILTGALMGTPLPVFRPLGRLLGIPPGAEALLIPGFLGGYPMGARAVADSFHCGQLTKAQACRLLLFLNNAGPAFLFGMVAPMFPEPWMGWSLWAIHVGSALLVGAMTAEPQAPVPPAEDGRMASLSRTMEDALRAMAMVCGWVICFRVISSILGRNFLWRMSPGGQALCSGLLELTNGCLLLPAVESWEERYVLAAVLLSLGGLCVAMQTASVLGKLPFFPCLMGKCLQAGISLLLAVSVVRGFWPLAAAAAGIPVIIKACLQKRGGNSLALGV